MSEQLPPVTVIVCTYNRADSLRKCLASVRAQDYPAFDILVVSRPPGNGEDPAIKVATDAGAHLVRQDGKGIANARNLGVRAAIAEYIAFIDDDCTAPAEWLRRLMEKLLASGASGVSGTALTASTGSIEFRNGTVDIYGRGRCKNAAPGEYYRHDGRIFNNVVCMNVAFRRSDVVAVGGFDEYFNYFYEETDLAARMIQAGLYIVHEPAAIVYHNSATDPGRESRQLYIISRNTTYMPLKNFHGRPIWRAAVLRWLCVRRMGTMLLPLLKGEISARTCVRCCQEISRGFRDGIGDGRNARLKKDN